MRKVNGHPHYCVNARVCFVDVKNVSDRVAHNVFELCYRNYLLHTSVGALINFFKELNFNQFDQMRRSW